MHVMLLRDNNKFLHGFTKKLKEDDEDLDR